MLSTIYTAALCGIDGFEVAVECSAHRKLPSLEIIGLADTAVKEAKERIRAAAARIESAAGALLSLPDAAAQARLILEAVHEIKE